MITIPLILLQLIAVLSKEGPRMVNVSIAMQGRDSYRLKFRLGKGDYALNRAINQENNFTWLYYKDFNESLYPSSRQTSTFHSGLVYEDSLSFINNNITVIPHFSYYIIDNTTAMLLLHLGSIGFGYKFENESYSIVHQLHSNDYIDHLSYAFVMSNNQSQIYFGGMPSDIDNNMKSGLCHVNQSQSKWACSLEKFTFGPFSYNNPSPFYFQVAEEPLYAPKAFMTKLLNHFFDKLINEEVCSIVLLLKRDTMKCLTEKVKEMPMINFTIEDYVYSFNATDFFEDNGRYSYLNILNNPYSNDTWIFGAYFVRHFNALFDYEGGYVKLYSNTKIRRIRIEMIAICYANCGVSFVGILFVIVWKIAFSKSLKVD